VHDYLEVWRPEGVRVHPLGDATRLVVGRDERCDLVIAADPQVSRSHAVFERLGDLWALRDLGSRNGTFVDGVRITGSVAMHHRSEVSVGRCRIVFCSSEEAAPTATSTPAPELTRREGDVLRALFRPAVGGEVFTEPASTREMAEALHVSEAAVKQHLANLYDKFGIVDGDRRRVRLANEALRRNAISLADVRAGPPAG